MTDVTETAGGQGEPCRIGRLGTPRTLGTDVLLLPGDANFIPGSYHLADGG